LIFKREALGICPVCPVVNRTWPLVMSLLTHYIRYCGPLWKRRTYSCYCGPFESRALTQSSCCWAPGKAEYMHITAVVGGPLKAEQPTYTLQLLLGVGVFQGRVLNYEYDVVRKILYEQIVSFSPKMRNIYSGNTLRGAGGRCSFAFP